MSERTFAGWKTSVARAALIGAALGFSAAHAAAPATAQTLVDRELAFAQASVDHGMRAAFLEYLADSAVIMAPGPSPARSTIESGPSPGAPLRWRPDLATMSRLHDFGWASGPFSSWAHSTDDRPDQSGHYFTVWWLEDNGNWRVVLDGGVAYPVAETDLPHHFDVKARLRESGGRGGQQDCVVDFTDLWRQKGRVKALKEYVANDARLLYAGIPPRDGKAIQPATDPLANAHLAAVHVARRLGSELGDIVVTYGEFDIESTLEAPARRLVFIQAWDVSGKCKLALEALNPAR